jgi:hypothetical protein
MRMKMVTAMAAQIRVTRQIAPIVREYPESTNLAMNSAVSGVGVIDGIDFCVSAGIGVNVAGRIRMRAGGSSNVAVGVIVGVAVIVGVSV